MSLNVGLAHVTEQTQQKSVQRHGIVSGQSLEFLEKFCYLDDTIGARRDASNVLAITYRR